MEEYHSWVDPIAIVSCAVLAILLAVSINSEAAIWFLRGGNITDWMQGLGTLCGAVIASRALSVWKRQENARRRSDLASEILRVADNSFHAARRACAPVVLKDKLLVPDTNIIEYFLSGEGSRRVAECDDAQRKLLTFHKLATDLLGPEVGAAVIYMEIACRQFPRARRNLATVVTEGAETHASAEWQAEVRKQLRIFGVTFSEREEGDNSPAQAWLDFKSEHLSEVRGTYDNLVGALGKYIFLH
ncbi:hypothetical protein [Hyphomicrobium sp.]|uniref:hypothetical protein n=1 Tax=Hyphomicrobium sp. TaxID=82 RepID=UPI0025C724F2|nr:hypothetical protein [Hyphomicrobium sp.]MCC7251616.1 hypothetical protein [Hyphomicrobium sp.]